METIMKASDLKTPEELEQFLLGNQNVAFAVLGNKTERYDFIRKTLVKMRYTALCKKEKGICHSLFNQNDGLLQTTNNTSYKAVY
jgi:hypothetical protein